MNSNSRPTINNERNNTVEKSPVSRPTESAKSPIRKGGRPKKGAGPLLAVELPVGHTRKNLSLKEPTAQLLAAYATFLSAHHGKAVDEDRVVEGLIESLRRDRLFTTWMKEQPHA